MALTRKLLRGMGLTDEQVETIIEAHTDTVDGLKEDINKYKEDAEKLPGVQKELDTLQKKVGDGEEVVPKADYDQLKDEYDNYKNDVTARETKTAKEAAYRTLLKEAGISSDRRIDSILKITDFSSIELAEDGKIKDADTVTENIKTEYSEWIGTVTEKGARVATPPTNTGGSPMTKDQIIEIKDPTERRAAIAQNLNLFEKGDTK